MTVTEFGQFVLTIALILTAVHGLGYLAERLKQPRIVGEILAGILLGPFVLKLLAPTAHARLFSFSPSAGTVMGFLYQLGLILLMFCSGAETRRLLARENRRNSGCRSDPNPFPPHVAGIVHQKCVSLAANLLSLRITNKNRIFGRQRLSCICGSKGRWTGKTRDGRRPNPPTIPGQMTSIDC